MKCIDPTAEDADLWILIGEEVHRAHQELPWVEHVEAHRTKKKNHDMSLSERVVTDSKERVDEKAKYGEMLDGKALWRDHGQRTSAEGCTRPCKMQQAFAGGRVTPL